MTAADHFAQIRAEIERRDKRFATLRAELARRGYQLHIVDAGNGSCCYLIARWDQIRELRDVAAVEQFVAQIGAR